MTLFKQKVIAAIRQIPPGETRSYKQIAEAAGSPHAYRAAATICANNDSPENFPCHRVIGSDGRMRGYRFGGVAVKEKLLQDEATAADSTE